MAAHLTVAEQQQIAAVSRSPLCAQDMNKELLLGFQATENSHFKTLPGALELIMMGNNDICEDGNLQSKSAVQTFL